MTRVDIVRKMRLWHGSKLQISHYIVFIVINVGHNRKFGARDRTRKYMMNRGWWTEAEDKSLEASKKKEVLRALESAGHKEKHDLDSLFSDVYDVLPPSLVEQYRELKEHISKYPEEYPAPGGH